MKKDRKGKLFFSLAGLMAVPILLLGVILVIVGRQSVSEGMELEIQKSLAGIARETIDVYGIAYPGEIRMEDERFYMGDADLTGDCALADRIKENTGADISIFWENKRVITTIRDKNGERIIDTNLDDTRILDAVFSGNECYSKNVQIRGVGYFAYYVPLYNDGEVCGMVFAGKSNESVVVNVRTIVTRIILVFVIALVIMLAVVSVFAGNIVDCVNKVRNYIGGLAENDFTGQMPQVVLRRKDEIGDMGRHAVEVAETIKELIATDALTGLFNRRAGRIELAKCMEKVHANRDRCVTVAMGDIDFFKQINDRYGHECGDKVLASIADIFKKHLENKGFPVRWGGEEFLLVFKEDKESALASLQKIMEEICNKTFDYEDCRFSVTITFGVARYDGRDSMDSLIKKADDLLYRGKAEGRNRIVV